jgi:energy-coupling factor transporter ATP-binding protein EcfA2
MSDQLELNNLKLFYGRNEICGPFNCTFTQGKINLIVGRAGSGKSTLLKTIGGFHYEKSGQILLNAQPFKPAGKIALAFQNPENLFFNPTVQEEVCYALRQKAEQSGQEQETFGKEWLEKWGLNSESFWFKHPMELSGGEKRKVALSACTVLQPPVIMLDEPLAGLDYQGQLKLIEVIEELAADHIVLLVTHDPEILLSKASGVLFLQPNDCRFFQVNQFVKNALCDTDFYPLPPWYHNALQGRAGHARLPILRAESVARFLNGADTDADYLPTC